MSAAQPHPPSQKPLQAASPTDSRPDTPLLSRPGPRLTLAGLLFASFSGFSTRRALVRRKAPITLAPAAARAQFAQAARHASRTQPPSGSIHASPATPGGVSTIAGAAPIRPIGGVQGQAAGQTTASTVSGSAVFVGEGTAAEAATNAAEAAAPELHNSGAVLAFEALALATINVVSLGMIGVGSVLWSFDIRGMDDLRRRVRGGLGIDGSGRTEQEVEEEMEEWVVGVLARKERKETVKEMIRNERGKERGV